MGLAIFEIILLNLFILGQPAYESLAAGNPTPGAVVAFYYPWYNSGSSDWNRDKMSSLPNPQYNSNDPAFVKGQMDRALNAGIDAFAVTWNGPVGDWDNNFKRMLASAGGGFSLAIHYETTLVNNNSVEITVNNLRHIKNNYSQNPHYLHYQGKPVIFFWRPEVLTPVPNWQDIRNQVDPEHEQIWSTDSVDINVLKVFDGIHFFSAAKFDDNPVAKYRQFRNLVNNYPADGRQRKLWLAGATPGYDDRKIRSPGEYRDREGGNYYSRSWGAVISSNPDMVTISTWNEWFEGSAIESGEAWGNQYLDLTRQYTGQYKGTNRSFGEASILKVWSRTDLPVEAGATSRTWLWGPENFATQREQYAEGPGGSRLVYYFDKSRMEITRPASDPEGPYFVTNGLLVREMMRGKVAMGDDPSAEQTKGSANIPVAGDNNNNPGTPTFAKMAPLASLANDNRSPDKTGQAVLDTLAASGQPGKDDALGRYGIQYARYEGASGHNIAGPFWDFFQRNGPVFENGNQLNGKVIDWIFAMGYPITEAFWARVKVGGKEQNVLVQAFERRIMTYTPDNPTGFQVEMGNVGRQYFSWRYGKS